MTKAICKNEQQETYIKLYDFIFKHEDFYEMRLTSKYLFCVMMDYMSLSMKVSNDSSITIPHEILADKLQVTGRSITTMKNELKSHDLIEETFMGIGKVTKITINQEKVKQYRNRSGILTFMLLPKSVYENKDITISSKVLYAFLLNRFEKTKTDSISLSNEEMSKMLNVSLSKARKTKKELVSDGKIIEQRRGHAQANTIQLND